MVKCVIAIAIMQWIIGSTVSLVGSGRRSIVPAKNGSQRVGGYNPLLTCGPSVTCSPKTEPKVAIKFKRH